jgi:hypothetical protein
VTLRIAVGLLLVAIAGIAAASALRTERDTLTAVSNRGTPSRTIGYQPQGGGPRMREAFLLARRGDHAFFRMTTADGSSCWGVTRSYPEGGSSSALACNPEADFPSRRRPVLDFSRLDDEDEPRVLRLAGFAADGVAQVGVIDGDDRVIPAARIFDNVYFAETLPSGDFYRLAALDREGRIIWRSPAS